MNITTESVGEFISVTFVSKVIIWVSIIFSIFFPVIILYIYPDVLLFLIKSDVYYEFIKITSVTSVFFGVLFFAVDTVWFIYMYIFKKSHLNIMKKIWLYIFVMHSLIVLLGCLFFGALDKFIEW